MKIHRWALALNLVIFAALQFGAHSALAGGKFQAVENIIRIVERGDSLLLYTKFYGATAASIRAANPGLGDPNYLIPGQSIVIPVARSSTPSVTTPFFYVVQAGEDSLAIARKFEIDHQALARANGSRYYPFAVKAGQTILIPAGPHLHIVLAGETLNAVAAAFCTNADALTRANNLANPGGLFVGQQLLIPIQYNAKPCARGVIPATGATPVATTGATAGSTAGALAFHAIFVERVTRDTARDAQGGALARTRVEFRGGAAPFTLFNDTALVGSGLTPGSREAGGVIYSTLTFDQPAICPVVLNHTIRIVSSDGQAVEAVYFLGPFACP